jgi:hypothetical protein
MYGCKARGKRGVGWGCVGVGVGKGIAIGCSCTAHSAASCSTCVAVRWLAAAVHAGQYVSWFASVAVHVEARVVCQVMLCKGVWLDLLAKRHVPPQMEGMPYHVESVCRCWHVGWLWRVVETGRELHGVVSAQGSSSCCVCCVCCCRVYGQAARCLPVMYQRV